MDSAARAEHRSEAAPHGSEDARGEVREPAEAGGRTGAARGRLRVLHVVWNLEFGGLERIVASLVGELDPDRFESHILSLGRYGSMAHDVAGAGTLHPPVRQSRFSLIRPVALRDAIARIDPDVVHSHSGVWYKATRAARAAGVGRVIHTEHGRQRPDPWTARFLDGRAARRTDVAVAVSEPLADELRGRVVGDACPVEVIVNGVDASAFAPAPRVPRSALEVPEGARIIGSVGRLEPVKEYHVMIRALELLRKAWHTDPRPVLVLVGDGSEGDHLRVEARRRGLEDSVRFLGWRSDVARILPHFDVFTLSSASEGTSVSLLEAMAAGVCPVVTDVGSNRSVLGESLRRRLVPSGDACALADAWHAALRDPGRSADGQRARARVHAHYSLSAMAAQYARLYTGGRR